MLKSFTWSQEDDEEKARFDNEVMIYTDTKVKASKLTLPDVNITVDLPVQFPFTVGTIDMPKANDTTEVPMQEVERLNATLKRAGFLHGDARTLTNYVMHAGKWYMIDFEGAQRILQHKQPRGQERSGFPMLR